MLHSPCVFLFTPFHSTIVLIRPMNIPIFINKKLHLPIAILSFPLARLQVLGDGWNPMGFYFQQKKEKEKEKEKEKNKHNKNNSNSNKKP